MGQNEQKAKCLGVLAHKQQEIRVQLQQAVSKTSRRRVFTTRECMVREALGFGEITLGGLPVVLLSKQKEAVQRRFAVFIPGLTGD